MIRPIRRLLQAAAASVALLAASGAFAQSPQSPYGAQPRNFYFGLLTGLTFGGESVATVDYTNGERRQVKAGELVHLGVGVVWEPQELPLALQATVGYHFGGAYASNGDVKFTRVPYEFIGYFTGIPNWRLGGGVRIINSPKLTDDVNGNTIDFKKTNGTVLEAGYRMGRVGWLNLRYIDEDYEADRFNGTPVIATGKYAGQSVGINFVFTF